MTFRKSILLLMGLGMMAALVACSSSSHPVPLTVSLGSVPSTLPVNSQTSIIATTNDTSGVTFACAPAGSCGTFTGTASMSTTYVAPAFPTTGVVITATSVANTAVSASTSAITIAAASLADGNYAYQLNGADLFGVAYSLSGVFTISGGAITTGEQDFVDVFNFTENDLINPTGSSVTTSADGNLTIVLATCLGADCTQNDANVGVAGIETLNGSVLPLNTNNAFITEFDASATSSGQLKAQDTTAAAIAPAGGYAFGLNGLDLNGCPLTIDGVINVDGAGTISGTGSVFDANDCGSSTTFTAETFTASTVSTPDTFGRVLFTLNPTDTVDFPQIVLAGYIVDSNRIFLSEAFDSFIGTTGGSARSQGANTGTFTATSISGLTYVAELNGFDTFFFLQAVGQFTFNADSTISGFINYNDLSGAGPQTPSPITGGNWVGDVGTGRVTLTGVTDGIITFNAEIDLVSLDPNANAYVASMDGSDVIGGIAVAQSGVGAFSAANFAGPYGMDVTGWDFNGTGEFDAVGPVVADGASAITGFADLNWLTTPAPLTFTDLLTAGTFAAPDTTGIFTGTITGLDVTTPANADVFVYYLVDPTGNNVALETDTNQLTLGLFVNQ
jgi:hypothetical protein